LIVPPEGSSVLDELKTPQRKTFVVSEQVGFVAQKFISPTALPEITSPGATPRDASGMMSGGFGLSGSPGGVGVVFVKTYAPFGSR
jgi:hypothetical protein